MKTDSEFEKLLKQIALSNGFNAWMKAELISAGGGAANILLPIREDMLQHHGFVHGGIIGTMADIACGWAASSLAGDVVTQSYTVQLLAPAIGNTLRAQGNVIKAGKRSVSAEARVFAVNKEGEEKLVATALATIAVLLKT